MKHNKGCNVYKGGDCNCDALSREHDTLKAENARLRQCVLDFDMLMSQADFKNGITAQGTDQGEVMASEYYYKKLKPIVDEVSQ